MDEIKKEYETKKELKRDKVYSFITWIIAFMLFGMVIMTYLTGYESTNNAYVEGRLIQISSRVSGTIIHVYADNEQEVKKGDLLVEIDPSAYQIKLDKAEVELRNVRMRLEINERNADEGSADSEQNAVDTRLTEKRYNFIKSEYDKYAKMYGAEIMPKDEHEKDQKALTITGTDNKIEKENGIKHPLDLDKATPEELMAEIQRLEALVAETKLELSCTKVYAPQDGTVSARDIEEGIYVEATQPLLSIIPKRVWIIANFKGEQMTHMAIGQSVKIKIDKYPRKIFKGVVENIQRSTDPKSSLFSPENAGNNCAKITFTEDYSQYNIVPGMSVVVRVKVK